MAHFCPRVRDGATTNNNDVSEGVGEVLNIYRRNRVSFHTAVVPAAPPLASNAPGTQQQYLFMGGAIICSQCVCAQRFLLPTLHTRTHTNEGL